MEKKESQREEIEKKAKLENLNKLMNDLKMDEVAK